MPITVEHGPNQSRYASVIAQSAKQTENYERMKDVAEFMQQVKQGNREYELGTKQNELTGRGQDIQYDLGLKDVDLRSRGLDLQEVDQNRMYALGLREQDLKELTQKQAYELGLIGMKQDKDIAALNAVASGGNTAARWISGNYMLSDQNGKFSPYGGSYYS